MRAETIVKSLIEDEDESPKEFLDRRTDIYTPSATPTTRFRFNIGEGRYRCGIAFDVDAGSRREAVAKANALIEKFFYGSAARMGSIDLSPGDASNIRVYVDDDTWADEADIVDESPL